MSWRTFRAPMLVVLAAVACLAGTASAGEGRGGSGPLTIKVEIEGVTQGIFDIVEGLASRSQVLEFEDDNPFLYPAPGPLVWSSLVLQRSYDPGLTGLWNWRRSVIEGSPQRRDGRILLFDARGRKVACWIFTRGWPNRWEVNSLHADREDPGTEIIEIVHEGMGLEL